MTKTMKNTLRSVLVMTVIAVVAVTLLALANAFFPEYQAKLDKKTAGFISKLLDLGVSEDEALNGGYIEMETLDADKLAAFNGTAGVDKNNKVLAVYVLKKGDKAGYRVVESQAKGYNDPAIVLLTSFTTERKIDSTIVKAQNENPPQNSIFDPDKFAAFTVYIKGKTAVSVDEIRTETGATSAFSSNGLANAVNIAAKFIAQEYGGQSADQPSEVTNTSILRALKKAVPGAQTFTSYPLPADKKTELGGIYKSDSGVVVVSGNSNNYLGSEEYGFDGYVRLIVTIDADSKIVGVFAADSLQSDYVAAELTDEWLTGLFAGKSADELKADDLKENEVIATATRTRDSVVEAIRNAIKNYPFAAEYAAGWEA